VADVLATGGGAVTTLDDELMECSTCALWEPLADRSDRGSCKYVSHSPWMTRGDDGDRYTHSDESCGFWLEKEAS